MWSHTSLIVIILSIKLKTDDTFLKVICSFANNAYIFHFSINYDFMIGRYLSARHCLAPSSFILIFALQTKKMHTYNTDAVHL